MAKTEENKTLDDIFEEFTKEHYKDFHKAYQAHKDFSSEDNMNELFNDLFSPAQDEMYQTIKAELDNSFQSDRDKIHGKKKEIRKAVAAGLKKYFEKVQPSVLKRIEEMEMDEDEMYETLTGLYDRHTGALTQEGQKKGIVPIRALEDITKKKKATVGFLKKQLYIQKPQHAQAALNYLVNQHWQTHFGKYHGPTLAANMKKELEKEGYEIEDKPQYMLQDVADVHAIHKALDTGQWGEQGPNQYGLKKKKKEDKKAA